VVKVLRSALELLADGQAAALVTVIATSGSTPRHPGAKMVVTGDGQVIGTIGGGRIELEAAAAAREAALGRPAVRLKRHLVRELAMCCGGSMELYIEPAAPSRDALVRAVQRWEARQASLLTTPLDGGPKRVVDVLPAGVGRHPVIDGEVLLEPLSPPARLVLFGGGHVAQAIGPLARSVGFWVVVCDDGEVLSWEALPAWVDQVVESFDVRDFERLLGPLGPADYAVILSRDHAIDQRVLEQLIGRDQLAYLGLIGSRGKAERFRRRLEAKGLAAPERWSAVRSPVGLDIGAETPEEIAVAVVAELIRVRAR
jgi:xanthine dehydrogenase accessory factor